MTIYYVDLAQTYAETYSNNGTASATPWGGPAGAVRAVDVAAAGDTILLANAATPTNNRKLSELWKLPVASTTNMDPGDLLSNVTQFTAFRIAVVVANDYVLAEPVGDDTAQIGDTVTPDGGTTTTTIDAAPTQPGLLIHADYAAQGTSTSPITLKGVAADWTTPEQAYLDGNSECDCLVFDDRDYWRFSNLRLINGATYGFYATSVNYSPGVVLKNVTAENAGSHGFNRLFQLRAGGQLLNCKALNNTGSGFYSVPNVVWGCESHDNGGDGFANLATTTLIDCLAYDNGGNGGTLLTGGDVVARNSVFDGNTNGLVAIAGATPGIAVIACRLTNNTVYGLRLAGTYVAHVSDYNVFYGNGAASSLNVTHGSNDHGPAESGLPNEDVTSDGYVNRTTKNFALNGAAAGRRMALEAYGTTIYLTAGFGQGYMTHVPGTYGIHAV
jgi:hypothetical protein